MGLRSDKSIRAAMRRFVKGRGKGKGLPVVIIGLDPAESQTYHLHTGIRCNVKMAFEGFREKIR